MFISFSAIVAEVMLKKLGAMQIGTLIFVLISYTCFVTDNK